MAKEEMGSVARTLLATGSGMSLGLLVDHFGVTPETLQSLLELAERLVGTTQGVLSLMGIVIAQGWSLHQKMKKTKEIKLLQEEVHYNE